MGFGKGFGLGLVLFIAFNFAFALLIAFLEGIFIPVFFSGLGNLSNMAIVLFGPLQSFPDMYIALLLAVSPTDLAGILKIVGYLVAPALAAILTGIFAEGKGNAILAWLLICMISAVALWILTDLAYGRIYLDLMAILGRIIVGGALTLFYGCLAVLVTGSSEY